MATVPRLESASLLGQPSRLPRQQPAYGLVQGLQEVAQGAEVLNQGIEQRDNARDIAFTAQQTATDQLAVHQALLDAQTAAPPDGSGVNATIQQVLQQRQQDALKAAPSDSARAMLAQNYAQLRVDFGVKAQTFEATQRAQYTVNQLNESVGTEAAVVAIDPSQFDAAVKRIDQNSLSIARNWNPAAISEWRKKGLEDLATAKVQADIMRDPMSALAEITSGKYNSYFTNNPAKLTALIGNSINEYTQLKNQAYTEQRRAQTQAEEDTAKAGLIELEKTGGNIGAFIQQHYDTIAPDYLKYFTRRMVSGPVTSNAQIVSDLVIAAASHDVTPQAQAALFGMQITVADFNRIASIARSASAPSTYKQGVDFIKTTVGPQYGVNDPGASGKADRMAHALLDWDKWTEAHKSATDTESIQRFTELGTQYRMMDQIESEFSYGLPRFYVGARSDMSMAKLKQARDSAQNAFQAGQISKSELDDEQLKIDQWVQITANGGAFGEAFKRVIGAPARKAP